jgi:hypothetical protein
MSQSLTGNNNFVLVDERKNRSTTLDDLESVAEAEIILACLTNRLQYFLNCVCHISLFEGGITFGEVSLFKGRLKPILNSYHHFVRGYEIFFSRTPFLERIAYLEVDIHLNKVVDKALLHLVALVRVADLIVDESEAFIAVQLNAGRFKLFSVEN